MPSAPRRRMSAAARREAILAVAMQAFAAHGYHGTSLDDIAHAAGISKALIYEHFASKRELHAQLVAAQSAALFDRLAMATAAGMDSEGRLRGGVDAFLGFVEERRDAWRALFRDAADPELGDALDRVQRAATQAIVTLILADPDMDPEPAALDVEVMAQLLSGAVQALGNWWCDHQDVPRALLVDMVVDFAWRGLERARARS